MEVFLFLMVGLLYAAGLYLILHRSFFKLILGMILFSSATNLFVFVAGGITRGRAAFIAEGNEQALAPFADPLPQALILTAIVIGFGIQAFAIVLIKRVFQVVQTNDLDDLNTTDRINTSLD